MEWGEEIKQRRLQEHPGALFTVGVYCGSEGAMDSDPPLATILAMLGALTGQVPAFS